MASKQPEPTKTTRRGWRYAVAIGLGLVALLALILSLNKEASAPTVDDTTQPADTTENQEEARATGSSFNALEPSDWNEFDLVTRVINESQGKEIGEESLLYNVVQDPNQDVVYFATSDPDEDSAFLGIYSMSMDNYQWERLYKATNAIEEDLDTVQQYHVLGYHDGRLIVRSMARGFTPEPCANPLLLEAQEDAVGPLLAMDLAQPYSAWEAYTLPDDVQQEQEELQTACLAEIE